VGPNRSDEELIERMDIVHSNIAAGQRELFRLIAEASHRDSWHELGARDLAHWLCMRYGISEWKARRWIASALAIEKLPRLSEAFECGAIGIDKVVELTRFATLETEGKLIRWANTVSCTRIRRKANLAERQVLEETRHVIRDRTCTFWHLRRRQAVPLGAGGARRGRGEDRQSHRPPRRRDPGDAG
jgi:hypothetical protein